MRKTYFVIIVVLSLLAIAAARMQGQTSPGPVTVVMEQPRQHISDFTLLDRLNRFLVMRGGYDVILTDPDSTLTPPADRFDPRGLLEWGNRTGCRYLIYLRIDDRLLERRKKTTIPFILNRYVVEGRLTGDFALLDMTRERVVGTWPLEAVVTGPQKWQINEDYPDDPDLNISAPQKILFLQKLEDVAVEEIMKVVDPYMYKGR